MSDDSRRRAASSSKGSVSGRNPEEPSFTRKVELTGCVVFLGPKDHEATDQTHPDGFALDKRKALVGNVSDRCLASWTTGRYQGRKPWCCM